MPVDDGPASPTLNERTLGDRGLAPEPSAHQDPDRPNRLPDAPRSRWRDLAIAGLLGLLAFVVFNANLRAIPAADTFAARYLPFSILQHHSVLLNPILDTVAQGRRVTTRLDAASTAFWIRLRPGDRYVSTYPIVVPTLLTPLYIPASAYLSARGGDPHVFDQVARVMEKLSASLIAAVSVALLYLLLRRRGSRGVAVTLSLLYAFGTTTWVISGQALWTHGLAQLMLVATMLLITGRRSLPRVALVGCLGVLIVANRQPDIILAAPLGLHALWWAGRLAPVLLLGGLVPGGLTLAYNLLAVGHVAGGYGIVRTDGHFNDDLAGGIAGLLFSPARGLFVFSPFLLFLPLLFRRALHAPGPRFLTLGIAVAACVQVVAYAFIDWRQGMSWGPRWLTDMLPLLMWLLVPIVASLARPGRIVFGAAAALSIAIQAVGAFWYTSSTDAALLAASRPGQMGPMWDIRNAPFVTALAGPPVPRDLGRLVTGNIDLVDVVDVVARDGAGQERVTRELDVAGWALADGRSVRDLAVLIDGVDVVGTSAFFTRPDVVQAMGTDSPAGWRFRIPAEGLRPGPHRIAAVARGDRGGEVRLLRSATFTVPDGRAASQDERLLTRAAALAEARLAERQRPEGYWLTAFTRDTRFERPRDELNTYLNAVMLDVAGPVAATPALQAALGRARAWLRAQIEPGGLVRYHGRPDAPTIGTLGCAITPDSDDTALAWRVAPGDDPAELAAARATMDRFRRPDGLYRTWLAERAAFQCLDPGRDPNPADIGIQMHIHMLLARQDPPAAAALCAALARSADDDSIWVYYAGAPPLVLLRLMDLQDAGCPMTLPDTRLQTAIPGQQRWVQAVSLLRRFHAGADDPALHRDATQLLRDLAAQDFVTLSTDPPLLYHNDMSASVRRFYWSADLGYALWLRLRAAQRQLGDRLGCGGRDAAPACNGP